MARKPKNISHVEAASLPLVSMTAYQALGRIEGGREGLKDKSVLVTAGSMIITLLCFFILFVGCGLILR